MSSNARDLRSSVADQSDQTVPFAETAKLTIVDAYEDDTPTTDQLNRYIDDLELELSLQCESIIQARIKSARDESEIANLRIGLLTARQIGAAIGILMATRKVTQDQAFALLACASQHMNRKLRDVADGVVLTGSLGDAGASE